jgi:hypothetical protein
MQMRSRPANATAPEVARSGLWLAAAGVAVVTPGATLVRVTVPVAPGATVEEAQETPSGRVPPQLRAIGALKPRILWVLMETVAVSPAAIGLPDLLYQRD